MKITISEAAEQDLIDGHRLLAKRFPFAIYYRVEGDPVQVYAVLDCRRNPAWIRDRLT
jgi:plasmid stabilization system protein ParE